MFTAITITAHEFLGGGTTDTDWRKLFVLTFEVDTNASEPVNFLTAASDYLMTAGIMNHPDIYVEQVLDSIKSNEKYVVLNWDFS